MDIPKFKVRKDDEAPRRPGQAPARVQDMAWARHKPASTGDLVKNKLAWLFVLLVLLGGSMFYLNTKAQKNRGYMKDIQEATQGKEPYLPTRAFPSTQSVRDVKVAGASGKTLQPAQPGSTGKSHAPAWPGSPKGEAKTASAPRAENSEKRRSFSYKEARKRKFLGLLPDFQPLENLDPKSDAFSLAYEHVFDEDLASRPGLLEASELHQAYEVVHLFYRFLRTLEKSPDKLQAYYQKRRAELAEKLGPHKAEASYTNVMHSPVPDYQFYRGQLYRFEGALIKKYQIKNWLLDKTNTSGVRYTWLAICRDNHYKHYAVLVPQDLREFLSKDDVDAPDSVTWRGLFLQRWSFVRQDHGWDAMPVYIALRMEKLGKPESGMTGFVIGIAAFLFVGLVFLLRQMRRDERQGEKVVRQMRLKALARRGKKTAPAGAAPQESGTHTESSTPPSHPAAAEAPVEPGAEPPEKSSTEAAPEDGEEGGATAEHGEAPDNASAPAPEDE